MCLRDGEQSVEDDEIQKYNLFTTDITERKEKNSPSSNHSDNIKRGKKKINQAWSSIFRLRQPYKCQTQIT